MSDAGNEGASAEARISQTIDDLGDWRGEKLRQIRDLIREADPDVIEEVKWVKPSNPAAASRRTSSSVRAGAAPAGSS